MKSLTHRLLISPVFWTTLVVIFLSVISFYKNNEFKEVIKSDGNGYYAYLPAIFLYNDPSYSKSVEAEKKYHTQEFNPIYLFKDQNGKAYNKYFPGVAILQLPFFSLACFHSWLVGSPIDGYSSIFQFWVLVGAWFYTALGLYFFYSFLKYLFPKRSKTENLVLWLIIPATPLLHYFGYRASFSHLYSFFMFAALAVIIINLKKKITTRNLVFLGFTLGLITLLRPTNILVVLIIPAFFHSFKDFMIFLKSILFKALHFLSISLSFLAILFLFFLSIRWQTGSWFVWNYNGEGFDFLHPKIWQTLFSFRTGLFIHSPILFVIILGLFFLFRKNKYQAIAFTVYFLINTWVISSWWCWDYENSFGHRPYSEHFVFLLPLVFVALKNLKILTLIIFLAIFSLSTIRYYEYFSGMMVYQRFTAKSYLESLVFWDNKNYGRWQYTRSCTPHGTIKQEISLLNQPDEIIIDQNDEFALTANLDLTEKRTTERLYFQVELDKKYLSKEDLKDVFLVVDAISLDDNFRYYNSTELFNDRLEGIDTWEHLIFENQVYDNFQQVDQLKIYIWNKGKRKIALKDIHVRFYIYTG